MEAPERGEPAAAGARMEPPAIRRLDESVVNRIAAGEVVQRPVSAVKELIENSLDANSTSVSVVVKDGGLKLTQVSDNGHGIRFEDLPILCERHTTSKLSTYEDLQTIKSMGFRGEALASMTYVGHVTVTTIIEGQLHGYRVTYKDGIMEHEPRPCAAVKGTQIMVENLFYNMPARRKTLQNSNDDYAKIVDLISRFAIHNIHVSFSCRKHGANRADIHTIVSKSRLDAIRSVYGTTVARDLLNLTVSDDNPDRAVFNLDGFISNANYIAKKTTMVLFINDRLVECSTLKRAIEVVYSATLPKASKPFVYMAITLPPEHVDVNIHPTKREVSLLNQESMVGTIQNAVELKLINSNSVRTFNTQVASPSGAHSSPTKDIVIGSPTGTESQKVPVHKRLRADPSGTHSSSSKEIIGSPSGGIKSQKVPVHKMVRTDPRDPVGRLHGYLLDKPLSSNEKKQDMSSVRNTVLQRRNPKESADLTSIQELLLEIDQKTHTGLLEIVKNCTYVGMADDTFALVQHDTCLYLANVMNLSKELMYQQVLRRFSHFNAMQLSDPAPLRELITMALAEEDTEFGNNKYTDLREKIAEDNTELLKMKAVLLQEYFCIQIDQQGNLLRLPIVLDQYTPDMDHVPEFLHSLANDVDWNIEKACFQTISAAIANFYAMHVPILPNPSGDGIQFYKKTESPGNLGTGEKANNPELGFLEEGAIDQSLLSEAENAWAQRDWTIQHVLFPSLRLFLKPPASMATNGTFVQVASLEKLYKIFERC